MARMTMHILSRNAARTHSMLPPLSPKSIELKVPMCCEVCEENVREELTVLEGVKEISIDVGTQKKYFLLLETQKLLCQYSKHLFDLAY
ncbi:hypothetical protein MPTK1_2g18260 [Marchantia polymorpha subsp. ruderalis]|uniref:HMA domain-containing protein n=1 Tax=Marchantia polymorpha TaxID=3197 RepID=A0A2R6W2B5_MARPO|nr:hypothetical protein MARPO_0177s0005 [Marchantia polymorpha]BBN02802.1 hypothetical protein Mp_2g18260 [Marchantia polymorpha subsp. ruderalis]|eukprot:PTQ27988.1 hypothetical protein MARPO_0177s0005 [Marchantia polymorpha]